MFICLRVYMFICLYVYMRVDISILACHGRWQWY